MAEPRRYPPGESATYITSQRGSGPVRLSDAEDARRLRQAIADFLAHGGRDAKEARRLLAAVLAQSGGQHG